MPRAGDAASAASLPGEDPHRPIPMGGGTEMGGSGAPPPLAPGCVALDNLKLSDPQFPHH